MLTIGIPGAKLPFLWWHLGLIAACILLAAFLSACGEGSSAATEERVFVLEANVHALEESLEALAEENTALRAELDALSQEQEAAQAAEEHEKETADSETAQEQQLAALEEGLGRLEEWLDVLGEWLDVLEFRLDSVEAVAALAEESEEGQEQQLAAVEDDLDHAWERLDDMDSRLQELEAVASQVEFVLPAIEKWFIGMDERMKLLEGTGIERTLRLAAEGGGQAQVINFGAGYGGARSAVLVLPDPLPEGEIPLIVSLHGFGSDSFFQSQYVPLHNRVNRDGFALLLPNGVENAEGQRFWNPTDGFGKADQDDVGALTALVQEAGGEFDMGPVYFFGYSNGGFMSYWMACQGLPGLRAVASLAGTSYMDAAACESAPPVSVLHIHGEQDRVVRFHGSEESQLPALKPGERYAGAKDMHYRWAERAGCDANSQKQGENLDLDAAIEGEETFTYRFTEGCADGITVELWSSDEGSHTPVYGDAFADALLDWLLAQE